MGGMSRVCGARLGALTRRGGGLQVKIVSYFVIGGLIFQAEDPPVLLSPPVR